MSAACEECTAPHGMAIGSSDIAPRHAGLKGAEREKARDDCRA